MIIPPFKVGDLFKSVLDFPKMKVNQLQFAGSYESSSAGLHRLTAITFQCTKCGAVVGGDFVSTVNCVNH